MISNLKIIDLKTFPGKITSAIEATGLRIIPGKTVLGAKETVNSGLKIGNKISEKINLKKLLMMTKFSKGLSCLTRGFTRALSGAETGEISTKTQGETTIMKETQGKITIHKIMKSSI